MTHRPRLGTVLLVFLAAALGAAGGTWYARRSAPAPPQSARGIPSAESEAAGPVAAVRVTALRQDRIEETLTAYGTVVAAPGETETLSVPFECRVRRVLVTPGQIVTSGAPLIKIEPSPESQLELQQALNERDAARLDLDQIQERMNLKLVTRQDLLQGQARLRAAELRVQSLEKRGIDGHRTLCADTSGIVSRIVAQQGQIMSAGAPLLEMIGERQINVRLGLETSDIEHVRVGQHVALEPVNAPEAQDVQGTVRLVTQRVDPQTRLVDVFVEPPQEADLMLNDYVRGRLVIASAEALVVPPAAVLPSGGQHILYTVDQGRAVRHVVQIGLSNRDAVQVLGRGLHPGQAVVIAGNSELKDGMAVRVETK